MHVKSVHYDGAKAPEDINQKRGGRDGGVFRRDARTASSFGTPSILGKRFISLAEDGNGAAGRHCCKQDVIERHGILPQSSKGASFSGQHGIADEDWPDISMPVIDATALVLLAYAKASPNGAKAIDMTIIIARMRNGRIALNTLRDYDLLGTKDIADGIRRRLACCARVYGPFEAVALPWESWSFR